MLHRELTKKHRLDFVAQKTRGDQKKNQPGSDFVTNQKAGGVYITGRLCSMQFTNMYENEEEKQMRGKERE